MKPFFLAMALACAFLSLFGCKKREIVPYANYSGQTVDQLLALEKARKDDPAILLALAEAFAGSGDVNSSLAYLEKAERRISSSTAEVRARIEILRSTAELAAGRFPAALKAAERAVKADKDKKTSAAVSYARALNAVGRNEESRASYAGIAASTPDLMGSPDWAAYIKLAKDKDPKAALDAVIAFQDRLPYEQGTGTVESGLREALGDFPGAVLAAYKDLSYAYSMGLIDQKAVDQGLSGVKSVFEQRKEKAEVFEALACIDAWQKRDYKACLEKTTRLRAAADPTSFGAWIIEASRLALSPADMQVLKAYAAGEKRYASFPEYWLRASIALSGADLAGSRTAAERCVAIAPSGPFASQARKILLASFGFAKEDPAKLLVKAEVDTVIYKALMSREPSLLSRLLPLLDLPDNPYTMYAVGALKSLSDDAAFAAGIEAMKKGSTQRAAERISYIVSR